MERGDSNAIAQQEVPLQQQQETVAAKGPSKLLGTWNPLSGISGWWGGSNKTQSQKETQQEISSSTTTSLPSSEVIVATTGGSDELQQVAVSSDQSETQEKETEGGEGTVVQLDQQQQQQQQGVSQKMLELFQRPQWWPTMGIQNKLQDLKYVFISKETDQTLAEISCLFTKFFSDTSLTKADFFVGLMLVDAHHTRHRIRTQVPIEQEELEEAYYYMRFATAVYGWQLIYGYNFKEKTRGLYRGLSQREAINPQVLAEHTGVGLEDIITQQWTSTAFDPGHYVVLDHASKSIVVAFRGTFHIKDALTDLVATYEPFLDGFAHCGMLRTALNKQTMVEPYIVELLKNWKDYRVVLVGHSLGAGTAALVAVLLRQKYPDMLIHCHAYATPCVLSLNLASRFKDLITTYVVGDDIVPRLSYGSMEELKHTIEIMVSQQDSQIKRLFQVVAAGNALGKTLTKKMEEMLNCPATPDLKIVIEKKITEKELPEKLYPPGKIIHMYLARHQQPDQEVSVCVESTSIQEVVQEDHGEGVQRTDDSTEKKQKEEYNVEESAPSLFCEIVISHRMFSDHMPDLYENVLRHLAKDKMWTPAKKSFPEMGQGDQ